MSNLASFWNTEACGQTVLQDRSIFIGQKLVENAKIQRFKCDIISGQKFIKKKPKMVQFGKFKISEFYSQVVLPDRSIFIGQKLVKSTKIQIRHLGDFQTMWIM